MSSTSVKFEDYFLVKDCNREAHSFEKVSRLDMQSENFEVDLVLDINSDIYPVEINDKFKITLVSSLSVDSSTEDVDVYDQSNKKTRADLYDYVMYGRVFRYDDGDRSASSAKVSVYVSFGGLLMRMKGELRYLSDIKPNTSLYLLMQKISKR